MVLQHSEFHYIPTIISVLHILYVFMLLIGDNGTQARELLWALSGGLGDGMVVTK